MKISTTEEMKYRQRVVEYAIIHNLVLSHMFDNTRD